MTKPHYNVLIATPGRNMEAEYVKSLTDTIAYLVSEGITYKYISQYSSQVHVAREATVMDSRFLNIFNNEPLSGEADYDKIMWIDSDMSWTVEDFMKVYNSEHDIISGVYFNEYGIPMFTPIDENANMQRILSAKDLIEANGVGFGFVCVKKGVFEKMPRPWFQTGYDSVTNDEGLEAEVPYGEDYSWCRKAISCGFEVLVDPTIRLGHHKKVAIHIPAKS